MRGGGVEHCVAHCVELQLGEAEVADGAVERVAELVEGERHQLALLDALRHPARLQRVAAQEGHAQGVLLLHVAPPQDEQHQREADEVRREREELPDRHGRADEHELLHAEDEEGAGEQHAVEERDAARAHEHTHVHAGGDDDQREHRHAVLALCMDTRG